MGIIYKATDSETGLFYIGKTYRSLDERKKEHLKGCEKPQNRFHELLNTRKDYFIWEVLCVEPTNDASRLSELERMLVKSYPQENILNSVFVEREEANDSEDSVPQISFACAVSNGLKKSNIAIANSKKQLDIINTRMKDDPEFKKRMYKKYEKMSQPIKIVSETTGETTFFKSYRHVTEHFPDLSGAMIKTRCKNNYVDFGYRWFFATHEEMKTYNA